MGSNDEKILDDNNYKDIENLKYLVASGFDFNKFYKKKDEWGIAETPLHTIITKSEDVDLEAVRFILDHGADVNAPCLEDKKQTLLYSIFSRPFVLYTNRLRRITQQIQQSNTNNKNCKPLYSLNDEYFVPLLELLLSYGLNPNVINIGETNKLYTSCNALATVLFNSHIKPETAYEAFKTLRKYGMNIDVPYKKKLTSLHLFSFNPYITKYLIDYGYDPNVHAGIYGATPLVMLCGYLKSCSGINSNETLNIDEICRAILESAQVLINAGARLDTITRSLEIDSGYYSNNFDSMIFESKNYIESLLHIAVHCGGPYRAELMKLLMDAGAPILTDTNERTPLHTYATLSGDDIRCDSPFDIVQEAEIIVEEMLKHGLDINTLDLDDNTPLHILTSNYKIGSKDKVTSVNDKATAIEKIYEILLRNGADPNIRNIFGKIPCENTSSVKAAKKLKRIEKSMAYSEWNNEIMSEALQEYER